MHAGDSQADMDATIDETIVRVAAGGAAADLHILRPVAARGAVLWLPAMGVPARNYLPFASALAARGVAVALHEWRGIGSSDQRAGRTSDWGYREVLREDIPASLAALRASVPEQNCWLGGHSLGGQLATVFAALQPDPPRGLLFVASGAPYWRQFKRRWLIRATYLAAPWLALLCGHFPGRRLGFGGNEARGVIKDWARSGRTGRYAAAGEQRDIEAALAALRVPVFALRLQDDWLGPAASLAWLLDKMPQAAKTVGVVTSADLGGMPADHFAWMRSPDSIAAQVAEEIILKSNN